MLQHSSKITKMDKDSFSYEAETMSPRQEEGPRLEILSGCENKLPPGFNRSGTEIGYFALTNGEKLTGAQKKSSFMEQPERSSDPSWLQSQGSQLPIALQDILAATVSHQTPPQDLQRNRPVHQAMPERDSQRTFPSTAQRTIFTFKSLLVLLTGS